jgi:hypothetical protein
MYRYNDVEVESGSLPEMPVLEPEPALPGTDAASVLEALGLPSFVSQSDG